MTPKAATTPARAVAVAALFGAELLHTVMIPVHVREWAPAGWFFLLVSVLEGAVAAALLFAPTRPAIRFAIGLSLATVAVWIVSRTVGIPFGPFAFVREPVGTVDMAATVLELATVAALAAGPWARWRRTGRVLVAGLAAVLAVTGVGLAAAPAVSVAHAETHAVH